MKNKKKKNPLLKFIILVGILIVLFFVTKDATKYYFYESDYAIKKTDLSVVSIDGIKIGMNIADVDLSNYTVSANVVDGCNYNYEELSIRTDKNGKIKYIVANYNKIDLYVGQDEGTQRFKKVNDIFDILGSKYKTEMYREKEDNYRKIARYIDKDNGIYLGLVYSRFNNEMLSVILSDSRIEDYYEE